MSLLCLKPPRSFHIPSPGLQTHIGPSPFLPSDLISSFFYVPTALGTSQALSHLRIFASASPSAWNWLPLAVCQCGILLVFRSSSNATAPERPFLIS